MSEHPGLGQYSYRDELILDVLDLRVGCHLPAPKADLKRLHRLSIDEVEVEFLKWKRLLHASLSRDSESASEAKVIALLPTDSHTSPFSGQHISQRSG